MEGHYMLILKIELAAWPAKVLRHKLYGYFKCALVAVNPSVGSVMRLRLFGQMTLPDCAGVLMGGDSSRAGRMPQRNQMG